MNNISIIVIVLIFSCFYDLVFTQSLPARQYPPGALNGAITMLRTQQYGNGLYAASASSMHHVSLSPHLAFSLNSGSAFWHSSVTYSSGNYIGTSFIVSDYRGEWLRIQMPRPINIQSYSIVPRSDVPTIGSARSPGDWRLYGSNDDSNWTVLDERMGITSGWVANTTRFFNVTGNSQRYFSRYVIVVSKLSAADSSLQIADMRLYGTEREFPPAGLTADSTLITGQQYGNGLYVASASSVNGSSLPAFAAFDRAFNSGGLSSSWQSVEPSYSNGNYTGSNNIVGGYLGEWLQIRLPQPIVLTEYFISPGPSFPDRTASDWQLYGSSNGVGWFLIDSRTGFTGWTNGSFSSFLVNTNQVAYSFYAIAVSKLRGQQMALATSVEIAEWRLVGEEPDGIMQTFTGHTNLVRPVLGSDDGGPEQGRDKNEIPILFRVSGKRSLSCIKSGGSRYVKCVR